MSLLSTAASVGAQPAPDSILSTTFARADWSLGDISTIRQAQLNISYQAAGDELFVYFLTSVAAKKPSAMFHGRVVHPRDGMFLVSDFSAGNRNTFGGYFNSFASRDSRADVSIAEAPDGVRGLQVECSRSDDGYCGVWIHTFDFGEQPENRVFLDLGRFRFLSFWIRGSQSVGVQLNVADAAWERREDSLPVGDVGEFLPAGHVSDDWQLAMVPLDRLPDRIDRTRLASLVFQQTSLNFGSFHIARLALLENVESAPPRPVPVGNTTPDRPIHKSTWIWHTAELIAEPNRRDSLIVALQSEGFDQVYLQLPDDKTQVGIQGEIIPDVAGLRPLVGALNAAGMSVFALDGYARYALPEYHRGVLSTVDRVIGYNRLVPEDERFMGIRYDIEPYLLAGFHGPARDSILVHFLELTKAIATRTREAGLVFGVDIPFWYDANGRYSGEPVWATFHGERKPVSHHVIDLVDEVAIMAYRTTAYGADGVIRHSAGELQYASEQGKAVLVAIETHPLPDEELIEIEGTPAHGLPKAGDASNVVVMVPAGDSVHVAVVGSSKDVGPLNRRISTLPGASVADAHWWPVKRRIPVPGSKLSFATLGANRMRAVMDQALPEMMTHPAFYGIAIHHAGSFLTLLDEKEGDRPVEPSAEHTGD
ncbi:MAG: hypothetical protein HKN37_02565 [Rhodothermales bacterium]|nr:hypothetical protein [Rhodothermales bacterium]